MSRHSDPPAPRPIISVGDLVADIIVTVPTLPAEVEQHQVASNLAIEPGGAGNFLIAGARLGQPMTALGVLGDDPLGHIAADILRAEGIDLAGLRQEGSSTTVVVLVSEAGEHVFLGKYGAGPDIPLSEQDTMLIKGSGAIFAAGYNLREARLVDLTLAAMQTAQAHGIRVYFDPGPQMAYVFEEHRQAVMPMINTLLLTADELPLLTEGPPESLFQDQLDTIVVKQGAKGCTIHNARLAEPLQIPGFPVEAVDTSAAGDSFNAAFITGQLRGWSLEQCGQFANAVGAAKVQKVGGGRNVPTRAEVEAVLTRFEVTLPF